MTKIFWYSCFLLFTAIYGCETKADDSSIPSTLTSEVSEIDTLPNVQIIEENSSDQLYHNFKLAYSHAGLGSNMGRLAPMFVVNGTHFKYTLEQNSYYGKQTKEPEDICEGNLSESTIKSIIELAKPIEDSLIYNTNVDVMSGGIDYLTVQFDTIDITFKLHNASNPIASKIAELLNVYIADEDRKISFWKD